MVTPCSLETTQNKTTTTINKLSTNRQVEHGHSECARSDGTVVRGSCGGGGRVVRGGGAKRAGLLIGRLSAAAATRVIYVG